MRLRPSGRSRAAASTSIIVTSSSSRVSTPVENRGVEPSVVIAVGTAHRAACYEASRYAIEALKARVPVWKKEITADGGEWKANSAPKGQ